MTQDEIIRMARDCYIFPSKESDDNGTGLYATFEVYKASIDSLQRFAALVAAHERERITEIVNTIGGEFAVDCAAAIRARGQNA